MFFPGCVCVCGGVSRPVDCAVNLDLGRCGRAALDELGSVGEGEDAVTRRKPEGGDEHARLVAREPRVCVRPGRVLRERDGRVHTSGVGTGIGIGRTGRRKRCPVNGNPRLQTGMFSGLSLPLLLGPGELHFTSD